MAEKKQNTRGRPKGIKKTGGRKKGTPNKLTQSVKDSLEESLNHGKGALDFWLQLKKDDPRVYASIIAKLIPHQINQELSGGLNNTVEIKFTEAERTEDA